MRHSPVRSLPAPRDIDEGILETRMILPVYPVCGDLANKLHTEAYDVYTFWERADYVSATERAKRRNADNSFRAFYRDVFTSPATWVRSRTPCRFKTQNFYWY